jgi:hypothetical protein
MEHVVDLASPKNKKIYALFLGKKQEEAQKLLPKNNAKKEIEQLLQYGVKQNNIEFMTWLIYKKKPHFEFVMSPLAYSRTIERPEITRLLINYIHNEKDKLEKELNDYKTQQEEKIRLDTLRLTHSDPRNVAFKPYANGYAAQPSWTEEQWKKGIKNVKPIKEVFKEMDNDGTIRIIDNDTPDCKCIIS